MNLSQMEIDKKYTIVTKANKTAQVTVYDKTKNLIYFTNGMVNSIEDGTDQSVFATSDNDIIAFK